MTTPRSNNQGSRIRLILWVLMFVTLPAVANAKKNESYTVGKWTYKRLEETHKFIEQEKYKPALAIVLDAVERRGLNDYERALLRLTIGFIYTALENFPKASKSFETVLAAEALPELTAINTQYNLAQVYIASGAYKKAIAILRDWFTKVQNPTPEADYLLAGAYSQIKNNKQALVHAERAVARAKRPKEAWLTLALALNFELEKLKRVIVLLKRLIVLYPKPRHWRQLAAAYSETGDSPRSLAVMEIAHLQGYMETKSHQLRLAQLMLHEGIPFKCGKTLGAAITEGKVPENRDNFKLLANCWLQSRETQRAIPQLAQAAKRSDDGELYLRLAQLHIDREEWSRAWAALESAHKKGELKDPGEVHLLQGIVRTSMKRFGDARRAFLRAANHPKSKAAAKQWLRHLETVRP